MKSPVPLLILFAAILLSADQSFSQSQNVGTDECMSRTASSSNNDGIRHDEKGEHQKAIDDYQLAIRAEPTCAAAYSNLGAAYFEIGRFNDSISACFNAAKYTRSLRWVILYNLGRSYSALQDSKNALESFDRSISLEPKEAAAYSSRARLYLALNEGALAVADVQKLLKLKGWKSPSAANWAVIAYIGYRQQKLDDQASQFLNDAATKIPDKTSVSTAIFRFFLKKINEDELLSVGKDEREKEPDKAEREKTHLTEAHAYIGMYLVLAGQKKEALSHFQWVRDNGSRKVISYQMAISQLDALQPSDTSH